MLFRKKKQLHRLTKAYRLKQILCFNSSRTQQIKKVNIHLIISVQRKKVKLFMVFSAVLRFDFAIKAGCTGAKLNFTARLKYVGAELFMA